MRQGPITPARIRILRVIQGRCNICGYPPTMAEIADVLDLSRPTVHEHIRRLVKDKYLRVRKHASRKYVLRKASRELIEKV